MKTFIATISIVAFAFLSGYTQEMPADLVTKLEAKAKELNPSDASKAKAWVSQQKTAWETIQCMTFSVSEDNVKLIKAIADRKHPLDYISQESFITTQAELAAVLPEYKAQLGALTYNAILKNFEDSKKDNISILVEIMQKAISAKMEIDSLTTDKMRPKTFALIKRVAAEEYPGNFEEQLKTIKEILEGKPAQSGVANAESVNAEATAESQKNKRYTNRELEKMTRDIFAKQAYFADNDNRTIVTFTEIHGKKVMLVPASSYTPGTVFVNARGEQLDYDPSEAYVSKTIPFLIIFPKSIPENLAPAKFINDKQYRELPGTSKFIVGYVKQNLMAYPVRINSISSSQINLGTYLPPNMLEGSMIVDPISNETLSIAVNRPPKHRKTNWLERTQIHKLIRYIETNSGQLVTIRLDNLEKWEKFDENKFYEQKQMSDRLKNLVTDLMKMLSSSNLSDSEQSAILGELIRKHYPGFKSKMDRTFLERKFKAFVLDLCVLIKAEQRRITDINYYTTFRDEVEFNLAIINDLHDTLDRSLKSKMYMQLLFDDIKRFQRM